MERRKRSELEALVRVNLRSIELLAHQGKKIEYITRKILGENISPATLKKIYANLKGKELKFDSIKEVEPEEKILRYSRRGGYDLKQYQGKGKKVPAEVVYDVLRGLGLV